jgi:hypothetical protein
MLKGTSSFCAFNLRVAEAQIGGVRSDAKRSKRTKQGKGMRSHGEHKDYLLRGTFPTGINAQEESGKISTLLPPENSQSMRGGLAMAIRFPTTLSNVVHGQPTESRQVAPVHL